MNTTFTSPTPVSGSLKDQTPVEPEVSEAQPDGPELYRLNTGYQFDVNPPCGEEVVIFVYNESDEQKAKAKAEAYLKRHAQDLLEWGQLDLEAVEEDLLKQYGLELQKRTVRPTTI